MSKTLFKVVVRDNMQICNFKRLASDIEEIKRAFKDYEIIKITPIEVKNFSSTLINGSSIRG